MRKIISLFILITTITSCNTRTEMDCKLDSKNELIIKTMLDYSKWKIPAHERIGSKSDMDKYFDNMIDNKNITFTDIKTISSSESNCNCSANVNMRYIDKNGFLDREDLPENLKNSISKLYGSLEKPYSFSFELTKKGNQVEDKYILKDRLKFDEEISGRLFDYVNLTNLDNALLEYAKKQ